MKKIALLLITTYSQTEKGSFFVGAFSNLNAGIINYSIESDDFPTQDNGKNSYFSISPTAGFFVIDNLVLGTGLTLTFSSYEDGGSNETNNNSISVSPFAKYYFSQNEFKPFLNASYSFGKSTYTFNNSFGNSESNSSINELSIGGGIAYFINETFSLELGINYSKTSNKQKDNNPNNYRDIYSGITSSVGFSIFL